MLDKEHVYGNGMYKHVEAMTNAKHQNDIYEFALRAQHFILSRHRDSVKTE